MNEKTNSNGFGHWTNKGGKKVFQTEMPLELQKGFNKKRIDHRHHAMDALVIACATRSHVNYLNNESAKANAKETRYDLRRKLRRIEKIKIKKLINEGLNKKKIQKFFADCENIWAGKDISKPELYYFSNGKEVLVASRTSLNESFKSKTIESITDTGIQKILKTHLSNFDEKKEGKIVEHPELAFSSEGIDDMNKNIKELNKDKACLLYTSDAA